MLGVRSATCWRHRNTGSHYTSRFCTGIILPTCQKYISPAEAEHIFPTLSHLQLCGASLVVTGFPHFSNVPTLDLQCLERLDMYPTASEKSHPDKVLSFHGGRLALRRALGNVTAMLIPPIARCSSGAPSLPRKVTGSISHKDGLAVAGAMLRPLAPASSRPVGHVGVDIEFRSMSKAQLVDRFAHRVLTDNELKALGSTTELSKNEEVMLRFSLKEAVYKSIAPELGRLVSYKEIEVQPREDGTATVTNKLAEGKRSKMFSSEAQWRELSPTDTGRRRRYWVSCVHSFDFSE